MHILGIVELIAQIYCIVHCIRERRSGWWILFILFVPLIGAGVYFFVEIFPELSSGGRYRNGTANANPLRYRPPAQKVSQLRESIVFSDTVTNRENLADELSRQGEYAEAVEVYQSCLKGLSANDVGILYKLAEAAFATEDYETSLEAVHKVRALSDHRAAKTRLLLARNHAALGNLDKAEEAFQQALERHSDIEIRYRYAEFLYEHQRGPEAMALLEEITEMVDRLPRHALKLNQEWINRAKSARKALRKEGIES